MLNSLKNSPIENLWIAFKGLTVLFSYILAWAAFIITIMALLSVAWQAALIYGCISAALYLFANGLMKSLEKEEKERNKQDDCNWPGPYSPA